ncbi:MAG: hypothetical protein FK733_01005 [Asgard group archaeon]|nr:hypothetical protein [Asgard group archaeon]
MKRELNDIEYMNFSFSQPYNIVVVLRITGKITQELLENALEKLQLRHPLLKARYEFDDKGKPWVTSDQVGKIPIRTLNRSDESITQKEFHNELVTHFDYDNTELPLFRVAFLPNQNNSDVILCGQHSICDGLSMVFLARDLLTYLNNPSIEVEVLDAPAKTDDIFPRKIRRRISKSPIRTYISLSLMRVVHAFLFGFRKGRKRLERKLKAKHDDIQVHSWNFTEQQTTDFLKKCKQRKISVHSAICTAYLPGVSTINNPVNLRQRLSFPVGESYGLFASGTVFRVKYKKRKDFWFNAQRYQRKLIWNLRDGKVFGIYKTINKSVPLSFLSKNRDVFVDIVSNQNPYAITNLGSLDKLGLVLDSDQFSVDSFYGAVSSTFDAVTILVFTLRKKMYFHLHYMESVHNLDELKLLSENVKRRLLES